MQKTKSFTKLPISSVVNFFIEKGVEGKTPITNKKLQKLLYYSQAWSMALTNKPLFKDKIEAWVHGPAIRSVYLEFRHHGFSPITKNDSSENIKKVAGETKKFLEEIWRVYGKHDASYLELLTHNETPWKEARLGMCPSDSSNVEISLESMANYYSELLKK